MILIICLMGSIGWPYVALEVKNFKAPFACTGGCFGADSDGNGTTDDPQPTTQDVCKCGNNGVYDESSATCTSSPLFDYGVGTAGTWTVSTSQTDCEDASVTDITVSSGTSTVTTSAAHGYSVGDVVNIDASNNTYDEEI